MQADSAEEVEEEDRALPIAQKDETNIINSQNDFQIVLNQIANDLEIKIKEMATLNEETALKLVELQQNKSMACNEKGKNIVEGEIPTPAAAEMENPYLDVM